MFYHGFAFWGMDMIWWILWILLMFWILPLHIRSLASDTGRILLLMFCRSSLLRVRSRLKSIMSGRKFFVTILPVSPGQIPAYLK
jgi:hypothetical protein